jgi:hypothetical protein
VIRISHVKRFARHADRATQDAWRALRGPSDWRHRVLICDVGEDPQYAAAVNIDGHNMMAVFAYARLNVRTGESLWESAVHEVTHVLGHELATLSEHQAARTGPTDSDLQMLNVGIERVTLRITRALLALLPCPRYLTGQVYADPDEATPWRDDDASPP